MDPPPGSSLAKLFRFGAGKIATALASAVNPALPAEDEIDQEDAFAQEKQVRCSQQVCAERQLTPWRLEVPHASPQDNSSNLAVPPGAQASSVRPFVFS